MLHVLPVASYIQSNYYPETYKIQGQKRTALQMNFHLLEIHCWMATHINNMSAPWEVGSHGQPVKEVLTTISQFLVRVLKTYNLFGNFIFLREAVREAILCTFNYKLSRMLKVLSQHIKLEETSKNISSHSKTMVSNFAGIFSS